MVYIKSKDNYKIYYNYANLKSNKPLIFFIHGWLLDHVALKGYIDHFKKNNYPIIYIDIRGHGKSDLPNNREDFSLKKVVNDIRLILLKLNIKRKITFFGYSLGGMISLLYALKYPQQINKLILISSSFKNPSRLKIGKFIIPIKVETQKKLYDFLQKYANEKNKDVKKRYSYLKKYDNLIAVFLRNVNVKDFVFWGDEIYSFDVSKKLDKIKSPIYFLIGDKDEFFSLNTIKRLNKKLNNAKVITFKGNHNFPLTNKDKFIKKIEDIIT
ncbi:MAG: alpha/beta fold hydrolase [Candidatus Woesearchaeota archaeon]